MERSAAFFAPPTCCALSNQEANLRFCGSRRQLTRFALPTNVQACPDHDRATQQHGQIGALTKNEHTQRHTKQQTGVTEWRDCSKGSGAHGRDQRDVSQNTGH